MTGQTVFWPRDAPDVPPIPASPPRRAAPRLLPRREFLRRLDDEATSARARKRPLAIAVISESPRPLARFTVSPLRRLAGPIARGFGSGACIGMLDGRTLAVFVSGTSTRDLSRPAEVILKDPSLGAPPRYSLGLVELGGGTPLRALRQAVRLAEQARESGPHRMLILDEPRRDPLRGDLGVRDALGYGGPSPASRAVQAVVAVGGWILFVFWWFVVLQRETIASFWSSTLAPVLWGVAAIAAVTALWILHNRRLARKGRRGTVTRYTVPVFTADLLGRPLRFTDPRTLRTSDQIILTATAEEKVYATAGVYVGRVVSW
jgi:hypothetical protein